jgi:hypothetical protein
VTSLNLNDPSEELSIKFDQLYGPEENEAAKKIVEPLINKICSGKD